MSKSSTEFDVHFSSKSSSESYKLLELPPEICKIIEEGIEKEFTIRGRSSDDAVLCTSSKTYALRSVALSNAILLTSLVPRASNEYDSENTEKLVVHEEISELLELIPTAPKLQRLEGMLKGCEYDEGHERDEEESEGEEEADDSPIKRARITREDIKREVQASDAELAQGLKQCRTVEINGYLRSLTPSYLTQILETILNSIVSQGFPLPPRPIPSDQLIRHLNIEHEYSQTVVHEILLLFGSVDGNEWSMDQTAIVREIGLGRLRFHKDDPANLDAFLNEWQTAVGDSFSEIVDIKLLEENYLLLPPPPNPPVQISYFPISALPDVATQLFSDLFLTRSRWLADDIKPFLSTVAVNQKEKEKLLMKFARATTDALGHVWYTARAGQI